MNNIVAMVGWRTGSEVCTIYLLEKEQQTLQLRASKGLSRRGIDQRTMKIGEGLTGLTAGERRAVTIEEARNHPRFRYFQETDEG